MVMTVLLAVATAFPTMAQETAQDGGARVSGSLASQLDQESSPGWKPVLVAVGFISVLAGCAVALVRYRTGSLAGLHLQNAKAIGVEASRRVGALQILVVTAEGNRFLVVSGPSGVTATRIEGSA